MLSSFAVERVSPSWRRATYPACVVVLFLAAAVNRFSLPQLPQLQKDLGYLEPALSRLAGGPFANFHGVNFLYAAGVYCLTSVTGGFRSVAIAQHFLGLLAAVCFLLIWRRLGEFLPEGRMGASLHRWIGLAGAAIYLFASAPIALECRMRPDALCIFGEMFACWLVLEAYCRRSEKPRSALLFALGAGASCVLLAALKPSFLLSCVLLSLLAGGIVLRLRRPIWEKGIFFLFTVGLAFLIAATQTRLTRDDISSQLFLPRTLFGFQAPIIQMQMRRDLESGAVPPASRPWVEKAAKDLGSELKRTRALRPHQYERLGFDPDRLAHGDHALFASWRSQLGPAAYAHFLRYWYWRSLREQPLAFLRKVGGQIAVFYRWKCPAFRGAGSGWLDYKGSAEVARRPAVAKLLAQSSAGRELARATAQLGAKAAAPVRREIHALAQAQKFAGRTYFLFLLATLAGAGLFVRRKLGRAVALLLVLHALVFGNVLSISALHSMEISRYSEVLFLIALLAHLWAIRCWIALLTPLRPIRRSAEPARMFL